MNPSFGRQALWLLCVVVGVWMASSANAQPLGRTLVATFDVGDRKPSLATAAQVEAQLLTRRVALVSMHEARDRFTEISYSPRETTQAAIESLAKGNALAVQHAAFGRAVEVQRTVDELVARAEQSIETLNRSSKGARLLLDTCLVQVRSLLHEGKRDSAVEQAMQCRRLVPDLMPTQASHPANVIGALAEADDQLRRMRTGVLSVDVATGRSCAVYLNGRHLGTTPFTFDRAAAGPYRVQLDCGTQPGRVHVVRVDEQPVTLVVDESFDQAANSEPRVGLLYVAPKAMRSSLVTHAALLAEKTHVDDVVLVRVENEVAQLVRVHVKPQRLIAAARVRLDRPKDVNAEVLGEAVDALSQGRTIGDTVAWEEPLDASAAPVGRIAAPAALRVRADATKAIRQGGNRNWKLWSGLALLAAGVGLEAGGWALYRTRAGSGDAARRELPMSESSTRNDWQDARTPMLALAGSGAAIAGTGSVFLGLSPSVRQQPWWLAGTSGAIGVALAVWGAVDLARAGSCSEVAAQACVDEEQQQDRGILLLAGALPFALVPFTKLTGTESDRLAAAVDRHGVRVLGTW